nr:immunoglobulin heavy chain junction region [Mus musculus]
CASRLPFFAYW